MHNILEGWPSTPVPSRLNRYRSDCEGTVSRFQSLVGNQGIALRSSPSSNCEPINVRRCYLPWYSSVKHGSILASGSRRAAQAAQLLAL
jgi:hypothetical protein